MKSIIFISLLILGILIHPSLQCKCEDKCKKCCGSDSGQYRLVPLYELFEPKSGSYFYTVSLREMNEAIKNKGYVRKNVIGLAAISSTDCDKGKSLIPVSRFYDKDNDDYLFIDKMDDTHKNDKFELEGVAFYGATTAKQCGATLPLYRFTDGKHHIYTTNIDDGKERAGKNGVNEGVICYIWPSPNTVPITTTTTTTTTTSTTTTTTTTTTRNPLDNPGSCSLALTKLFRLYRESTDSFLFTDSYDEALAAYTTKSADGSLYIPQASPGYAAPEKPTCRCDLQTVYRVDKTNAAGDLLDLIMTNDKQEADDAVSKSGYTSKGIAFYCAKGSSCGARIPYYRYKRNNALKNHFYTTNQTEATAMASQLEGVLCNIWPEQ